MAIANPPITAIQNIPSQTLSAQNVASQAEALSLHDIHLPEPISHYPVAPGWWLLLTVIIISAVCFYRWFKKNKRLNSSKKKALTLLKNNPALSATQCISLLKWAAMQYGNRQQLAKLYGVHFQDFLVNKIPEQYQENFTRLITPAFEQQYQAGHGLLADATVEEAAASFVLTTMDSDCYQATKLWLNHALPIKKSRGSNHTIPVEQSITFEKEKELSA